MSKNPSHLSEFNGLILDIGILFNILNNLFGVYPIAKNKAITLPPEVHIHFFTFVKSNLLLSIRACIAHKKQTVAKLPPQV